MKFISEVTKSDFKSFNKIAHKRVAEQRGLKAKLTTVNILYWIPLGIAAGALYHFYNGCEGCDFGHLNVSVALVCAWVVAGVFLQKWYFATFIDHAVSDSGTVLGKVTFILDEGGVTEIGEGYKSTFAWSSIQSVERDGECLFLFTDYVKAVIFPIGHISDIQLHELSGILRDRFNYELIEG